MTLFALAQSFAVYRPLSARNAVGVAGSRLTLTVRTLHSREPSLGYSGRQRIPREKPVLPKPGVNEGQRAPRPGNATPSFEGTTSFAWPPVPGRGRADEYF